MNLQNRLRVYLSLILFILAQCSYAYSIPYSGVVRNVDEKAIANSKVDIKVTLLQSSNLLYSENFNIYTDEKGLFSLNIGDGLNSEGNIDLVDWSSKDVKIRIIALIDNLQAIVGETTILGVPTSISSTKTKTLRKYSPNGTLWELSVNNAGDLKWKLVNAPPSDGKDYPQELYIVGSFNNWNPEASLKFQKIKDGMFKISKSLKNGDIIKFIKVPSWNGDLDWSGTSGEVNVSAPLKEWGNTPSFAGESGMYSITVDFIRYILLITPIE